MSQPRNPFTRLEEALQGAFEGVFGRVFPSRLQPIELSRRLERAMDENLIVSPNRRLAPNNYQVTISAQDFARFEPFLPNLIGQLRDGLIAAARKRGYTLTARPRVAIAQDAHLGRGDVRIVATLLDAAQLAQLSPAANVPAPSGARPPTGPLADPPDGTQLIAPGQAPDAATVVPGSVFAGAMPYAALVLRTTQGPGQVYPLNREVIHIGRHTSNDIVVNERRVSRYHVEIRYERGQFIAYDLGSLNGLIINGSPMRQAALRNGDILAVGSYSFVFERR